MSYSGYWQERANLCKEFADEGECLARVARHVPVTIGGLGVAQEIAGTAVGARVDRLRLELGSEQGPQWGLDHFNDWSTLMERLDTTSRHFQDGLPEARAMEELDRLERDMWMKRRLWTTSVTPPIALGAGALALGLGTWWWARRKRS